MRVRRCEMINLGARLALLQRALGDDLARDRLAAGNVFHRVAVRESALRDFQHDKSVSDSNADRADRV